MVFGDGIFLSVYVHVKCALFGENKFAILVYMVWDIPIRVAIVLVIIGVSYVFKLIYNHNISPKSYLLVIFYHIMVGKSTVFII